MANDGRFKKGNPGGPGSQAPKYTKELGDEICARLSQGESLSSICKDEHMPAKSNVVAWALQIDTPFAKQYAHAREIAYQHLADELLDIADDGRNDKQKDENGRTIIDHDHISRSRLRTDTRKWILSKMLPKVYGDKVAVTPGEGLAGGSVEIKWLPPDKS